jgi:hypothetical protein
MTEDQVTHWLLLDRSVHVLWEQRSGWHHTLCGTLTPNGLVVTQRPERPKAICRKCKKRLPEAILRPAP